eukprot:5278551-Alexandrium_andersonii.AAC.1
MGKRDSMALALVSAGSPDSGAGPAPADSPPKKLPKVVSEVQAAFGLSAGGSLSVDQLKAQLSKDQYNNFCNTFRYHLSKEQKAEYKTLTTKEKEDWLCPVSYTHLTLPTICSV